MHSREKYVSIYPKKELLSFNVGTMRHIIVNKVKKYVKESNDNIKQTLRSYSKPLGITLTYSHFLFNNYLEIFQIINILKQKHESSNLNKMNKHEYKNVIEKSGLHFFLKQLTNN